MKDPKVYSFRIILDDKGEIFRDLCIKEHDTFEDLCFAIIGAFNLDKGEMASFYKSNDSWHQGEEIPLANMDDTNTIVMKDLSLKEYFDSNHKKMIFVYDYLHLWTFFITLYHIEPIIADKEYPYILFAKGKLPPNAPQKNFKADESDNDFISDQDPSLDPEDDTENHSY